MKRREECCEPLQAKLIWLASYPKSGNTWLRLFLNSYINSAKKEFDINRVDVSLHSGSRELFDRVIGLEASDLTPTEIDRFRPDVYRQLAIEATEPMFLKVHDCWRRNAMGVSLFPNEITAATIYIVRDPRAVAPSYASHYGLSIDEAIAKMASFDSTLSKSFSRLGAQLPQFMGSWSQHVTSWLDQDELSVHLIRYEDLHAEPKVQFTEILRRSCLPLAAERLQAALVQTQFESLRIQEAKVGFRERLSVAPRFFRKGRPDAWHEELTARQIAQIESDHGEVMERLGYSRCS